jgi:metal-dependent amidase/aminoacylase/carboxypeptidase family protein
MEEANIKVDRALRAGALAMGATVRITNMPGHLPITNEPQLTELFRANAEELVGPDQVGHEGHRGSTTDTGDLSHVLAVVHPMAGGCTGNTHGADFVVADYELAVINPAKAMAMTAIDLLADDAAQGNALLSQYTPRLSKEAYLAFLRKMAYTLEFDGARA